MTATRFRVVGRLAGFVGALCVVFAVIVATMCTVIQHVGAVVEGLEILGTPRTPTPSLPLGAWAEFVFADPTFLTMAATMFAVGLWLTCFLSVRGSAVLCEDALRCDSVREFIGKHSFECVLLASLILAASVASYFDWRLWLLRARVDLATGNPSQGLQSVLGLPLQDGETAAQAANQVARTGALGVLAITLGLAIGLEASLRWCGRAWERLATAMEDLRQGAERDVWLDEVVPVVGASARSKVTRRSAALNPAEFVIWGEHVFSREYVGRLEKHNPRPHGSGHRASRRGFVARVLASGFGAVLLLLASSPAAGGDQLGYPSQASGRQTLASAAGSSSSQGQVHLIVALDFSDTAKARASADVDVVRSMLKRLVAKRPRDGRHRPTARVVISIVSIDALTEVVWSGTELSAGERDDGWWNAVVAERQSYGRCTSLANMWTKVSELVRRAGRCDRVELLIFSDLIAEEGKGGSAKTCAPPQVGPSSNVPWNDLARIDVMRVYGVPSSVKAAWGPALRQHRLEDVTKMYPGGDPAGHPPVLTPAESCPPGSDDQATANTLFKRIGIGVVAGIVAIALLPFLLG